jgi:peptidoglycan/LPS O-acetylase OafA/YrhL
MQDLAAVLRRRHLPALDGLRFVAVFVVMLGHFGTDAPPDIGVSAFFVLSGFLITWLLFKEQRATGTVSLRRFYVRRVLRIFPAYYVFLAFSISWDLFRHDSRIRPLIVPALLYVVNYYNALHGHPQTSVSHAWSLAIEEQFYLLWPLAFLLLARHGRRALAIGLISAIAVVVAWRCVAYFELRLGSAYVYDAFDTRFDMLAIGCLMAVVADTKPFAAFVDGISTAAWMPLVTIALLLVSRELGSLPYHYGLGFTVDASFLAVFIMQMLVLHETPLWRWLSHPVVVYLGTISYGLYLYHGWGLTFGERFPALTPAGEFAVGVAVTIVFATGSYFVIERPFLALKQRLEPASIKGAAALHLAATANQAGGVGAESPRTNSKVPSATG